MPLSCPQIAIMMMLEQASFVFVERTSRCFVNALQSLALKHYVISSTAVCTVSIKIQCTEEC